MRALVNSVTYWDVVCLNKISGLDGKKLVSIAVPWISHSGNGYYYPALPLVMFFFDPEAVPRFLLAALAAFALELPLYKLLKNCIKRDRPCEALTTVQRRIVPSDRFSFPSGHTAAAIVMATLVICGAGFELAGEALQLGKKLLVKPLKGQFEQLSNALALEKLQLARVM